MSRVSLDRLLAELEEPPTPEQLEQARLADLRSDWAMSEARRARALKLNTLAAEHERRAREHRRDAQRALGL